MRVDRNIINGTQILFTKLMYLWWWVKKQKENTRGTKDAIYDTVLESEPNWIFKKIGRAFKGTWFWPIFIIRLHG